MVATTNVHKRLSGEVLVCPACHDALEVGVRCVGCGLSLPIHRAHGEIPDGTRPVTVLDVVQGGQGRDEEEIVRDSNVIVLVAGVFIGASVVGAFWMLLS